MKDFFKRFKGNGQGKLTPKEEALKSIVEDQNLILVCSTALRTEKQLKTDKKRHRTGQVGTEIIKQKRRIHNYQQRVLEKQKTRQKNERRYGVAA